MPRQVVLVLAVIAGPGFAEDQKPIAALQGTWKGITYQEADDNKVLSGENFGASFW